MKRVLFILLFIMQSAMALPDHVEVWFLSGKKKNALHKLIDEQYGTISYQKIAQREVKCIEFGDGCFDPQIGYYDKKTGDTKDTQKLKENKQKKVNFEYLSNMQNNMIDCKKGYYFDLYCGKAKKVKNNNPSGFEVWLDISSSFSGIDYSVGGKECHRKSFAKRVQKQCGDKVDFYVFDTGKKQIQNLSYACEHRGLNDQDRIIRWIKESSAKNILIITDISEYTMKIGDFLNDIGGKIKGEVPHREIIASDLVNRIGLIKKNCQ